MSTIPQSAIITSAVVSFDISNFEGARSASKVHVYDQPLEVLAALLAIGFLLTMLVRTLCRPDHY